MKKPIDTPKAMTVNEFVSAFRIGRTTLYRHIGAGLIRTIHIGKRRLVPASEIERLEREGAALRKSA
jgi:hypothetical protein